MKFVDSNIFLHALLLPRRKLTRKEEGIKEQAKSIVRGLEAGEDVTTTVVHLSEVVNIIETALGLEKSLGFLAWAIASENVAILPVTLGDYESVLPLAGGSNTSANDALACLSMRRHEIREIYSFDKHFDRFKGIVRLPKE